MLMVFMLQRTVESVLLCAAMFWPRTEGNFEAEVVFRGRTYETCLAIPLAVRGQPL